MSDRRLEDEINPPLSSALVIEPQAVREEIRGEDEEISQMQHVKDIEKEGDNDVVESVASEEAQPKIPILDFPDGGTKAWLMVFGAWWISFSTFGILLFKNADFRICELVWHFRDVLF
jgi:hypothetical protein